MKKLFTAAALVVCCLFSINVSAQYCDLEFCATYQNVDSGANSYTCLGDQYDCTCFQSARIQGYCSARVQVSSPGSGWILNDQAVNGKYCWVKNPSCPPNLSKEIIDGKELSLAEVFANRESRNVHYGFINEVSRSPNNGRSTSAPARLDACVGYAAVDGFSNGTACRTGCETSTNGYCRAYNYNDGQYVQYAVCKDRCDCVFGDATCNNL